LPGRHLAAQQDNHSGEEGGAHDQRWGEYGQILQHAALLPVG